MLKNLKSIGIAVAVLSGATFASAQNNDDDKKGTYLGVKAGLFMPSDGEIRDIFGSSIVVFGLSFEDFRRQADKWRLTADFDFIGGQDDDDRFFIVPVTASLGRVFGNKEDQLKPYVKVGAGVAYINYAITRPTTLERFSDSKFGMTANAEVGLIFSDRLKFSAKYVWLSKVDDFDFSGIQLTLTYNVFKF